MGSTFGCGFNDADQAPPRWRGSRETGQDIRRGLADGRTDGNTG
jgi:hypothetical protein